MKDKTLNKLHNAQIEILDEIDRICKKNKIQYFLTGGTLLGAVRHNGFIPWDDDLDIAMPRNDYTKFVSIADKELNEKYIMDSIETNKLYWLPFGKVRIRNTILDEKGTESYKGNKGIWVDIFPLDNAKKPINNIQKFKYNLIIVFRYIVSQKLGLLQNRTLFKKVINIFSKIFSVNLLVKLMQTIMKSNKNNKSPYFINYSSKYGIKRQTHLKTLYYPAIEIEFEGKKYSAPKEYKEILKKIYGDNYMELPPKEKRITHNPLRIKFEDGEEYTFE